MKGCTLLQSPAYVVLRAENNLRRAVWPMQK